MIYVLVACLIYIYNLYSEYILCWYFSASYKWQECIRTHLSLCRYLLLWSDFNQKWNMLTNFSRLPSIKFHDKPFSCSKIATHGQTGTEKEEKFVGAFLQPSVTYMPKTRLTVLLTNILKTSVNKVHSFSLLKKKYLCTTTVSAGQVLVTHIL